MARPEVSTTKLRGLSKIAADARHAAAQAVVDAALADFEARLESHPDDFAADARVLLARALAKRIAAVSGEQDCTFALLGAIIRACPAWAPVSRRQAMRDQADAALFGKAA